MGRGIIIICMGLSVVFGLLQITINSRHQASSGMNVQSFSHAQARNLAYTGIELAVLQLNQNEWQPGQTHQYVIDNYPVNISIASQTTNEVLVISTGIVEGRSATAQARLHRNQGGGFPSVNAAVMVMNDDFALNAQSNSWLIQGRNTIPGSFSGGSAGGGDLPGISATDPAYESILNGLPANRRNRVQGADGLGSPNMVRWTPDAAFRNSLDQFTTAAGSSMSANIVNSGQGNGNMLGRRSEPVVTVIKGDVFYAGANAKGAGVLIVEEGSTLDIRGSFEFEGLVIVKGRLIGRGNATIWGSVIFSDDYRDGDDSLIKRGRPYIYYSESALQNARNHTDELLSDGYVITGMYEE